MDTNSRERKKDQRFTSKLGGRRLAWGLWRGGEKSKKRRSLGRRPRPFFLFLYRVSLSLSFSCPLLPPIAISHRFRARNKFINKRAGDPRQLQGAPAEIERLENNRQAKRDETLVEKPFSDLLLLHSPIISVFSFSTTSRLYEWRKEMRERERERVIEFCLEQAVYLNLWLKYFVFEKCPSVFVNLKLFVKLVLVLFCEWIQSYINLMCSFIHTIRK